VKAAIGKAIKARQPKTIGDQIMTPHAPDVEQQDFASALTSFRLPFIPFFLVILLPFCNVYSVPLCIGSMQFYFYFYGTHR
jgi:hypothetical protein